MGELYRVVKTAPEAEEYRHLTWMKSWKAKEEEAKAKESDAQVRLL